MIVEPGGPDCLCGSKGCLEALASSRALVEGAEKAHKGRPDRGALYDLREEGRLSSESLFRMRKQGGPHRRASFSRKWDGLSGSRWQIFSLCLA